MDLGALQKKATMEIERFEKRVGAKAFDEMLFLYVSKISEEIGNLAAGVLGREQIDTDHPVSETQLCANFADALYSIVVLAQKMDVDLVKVMAQKVDRIDRHHALEGD